jgi:hypothetical protein
LCGRAALPATAPASCCEPAATMPASPLLLAPLVAVLPATAAAAAA